MKFKPALTSLLATLAIAGAAASASAATPTTITTTVLSGDPAAPNSDFTVLVSLTDTTSTLEVATLKVLFDSRRTDLIGVSFPTSGFGGAEINLIDAPLGAPATLDANDFKYVSGFDANDTNTFTSGDVFVLTFRNGKWPARPLNIRIANPDPVRTGADPIDTLIFDADPSAAATFFGSRTVNFINAATVNIGAADADLDGIPDSVEAFNPSSAGTNPNTNLYIADSDADGLTDYDEREITLTNPRRRDTDSDGLLDGIEVLLDTDPLVANTGVVDADKDGFPASANDDTASAIDLVAALGGADPDDANPDVDGDLYRDGYELITVGFAGVSNANVKPTLGDINNSRATQPARNGVNTADALIMLRVFGTNSLFNTLAANVNVNKQAYDLNRDGNISTTDALVALRFFGNAVTTLPLTTGADSN